MFLLLILVSCKSEKPMCNSESLLIINKAKYFFGGSDEVLLVVYDIEEICDQLEKLIINKKAIISDHTGYIEIRHKDNNYSFFEIVFTKRFGPIIKYKGDYYENDVLVKLVADHLKMDYNRIVSTNKNSRYRKGTNKEKDSLDFNNVRKYELPAPQSLTMSNLRFPDFEETLLRNTT